MSRAAHLLRERRWREAEEACAQVLKDNPRDVDALFLTAGAAHYAGDLVRAADLLADCISQTPENAELHLNRGDVLMRLGRLDESIASLRRALELRPDLAAAYFHLGLSLQAARRRSEAVDAYSRFLQFSPKVAQAHYNLGVLAQDMDNPLLAIEHYTSALKLKPDHLASACNLGSSLLRLRRYDDAISVLEGALQQSPDAPMLQGALASALGDCGRVDEAVPLLRQAVQRRPNSPALRSALILRMQRDPASSMEDLHTQLRAFDEQYAIPLRNKLSPPTNDRDPDRPLRIGFVCSQLHDGVISWNTMPLFRNLDCAAMQMFFYSSTYRRDHITCELEALASGWRDVQQQDDDAMAQQIREDRIDVLVDFDLHTAGNRLLVLARKAAPVQVTFAGYPGSTGLSAIDLRISDAHLDPVGYFEPYCSEQIARLSGSFWCYESQPGDPGDVAGLPAEQNGHVTFACLNELRKLNREVIALFAEVMRAVPRSKLLLLSGEGGHLRFLRDLFQSQGIESARVVFLPPARRNEYMAYYRQADISLDPFPYGGHTTGLDSFWMGVPLVTLEGRTIVSRAGVDMLQNLRLPELIGRSPADYVRIAAELAGDIPRLRDLRRTLRDRMLSSPLTDAKRFAGDFGQICRTAWRCWCDRH